MLPEVAVNGSCGIALVEGVSGGLDPGGATCTASESLLLGSDHVADQLAQVAIDHQITEPLVPYAVLEPEVDVVRKQQDVVGVLLDQPLLHLVQVIAVLGDLERRPRRLSEADRSVALQRRQPDIDVGRYQRSVDGRLAVLQKMVERRQRRATTGADASDHLVFGGAVQYQRGDAGPAGVGHLGHLQRHRGGDSGIEGVAAGLERLEPRRCGEVVSGGDGAMSSHDPWPHGFEAVRIIDMPVTVERSDCCQHSLLAVRRLTVVLWDGDSRDTDQRSDGDSEDRSRCRTHGLPPPG